jgi:hypothetical protein
MSSAALSPSQVNRSESAQWRQIIRQSSADLRVSIPAILSADMDYNGTQTVSVQIAIQERAYTSGVNPGPAASASSSPSAVQPPVVGPQWVTLTPVLLVPVVLPGGGGFSQTFPLKKGDEGLLVFCDCCFDLWWQRGGVQNQAGNHRHEFWDCGFIPGMRSQPNILADYSTDSAQLRADDGSAYVDVAENAVTISGADTVDVTAPAITATATDAVNLDAPAVNVANGGTPLALVNATWYAWWATNIFPFLQGLGYAGPPIPAGSETTVLKAQ